LEGVVEMSLIESTELFKSEIVIVDDAVDNLKLLSDILKSVGYSVIPEMNGKAALRRIEEKLPSLILLDVMMPEMDGFEVCRRLKENEKTHDIPVIFISALDDEKSKLAGFRSGGVDYISKPFKKEEVLARVKSQISLFRLQLDLISRNNKLKDEIARRKQAELAIEKRMIAMTQPLEDSMVIDFEDLFNINEIQKLQDQFACAFGVATVITQTDGTPITKPSNFSRLCQNIIRCTEKGLKNCMHSDAVIGCHNQDGPIVMPCLSGGLWDAGASITVGGKHVANWLIGQVRNEYQNEGIMREYALEIGADPEDFISAFYELTPMSQEQFQKISNMLFTMAGQLSDMAYQNAQQSRFINGRKIAEEALADAEEKMEAFFDQSLDGFFFMILDEPIEWNGLADKDQLLEYAFSHQRITRINDAMLDQYGATRGQFIGLTPKEMFAHDILHGKNIWRKLFDNGKLNVETDERKLNGEQIIIEGDYTCLYDIKGRITGHFGIQRDITQNKLVLETIKNERKILRTLIDHLPDAIYVKDKDGRKIVANLFDIKNIGLSNEAEALGKTDLELFDSEIGKRGYEDDLRVIRKGEEVINHEEVFIDKNGFQRWLLTSKLPLYDQRGKVSGLVGIGRDITEQKRASETILKLTKSIEQSPSTIMITDINGIIEFVNPKFTEITGYAPDEVIGKNPRILKSGETSDETYKKLWKTISSGEVWRGEFLNRRKDGELYWEWATMTSIKNENGNITNYISIKEDISARKQLEIDLIIAKEKAEENDRLKSTFLANMSHEIRTPLNSIIGFSELLSDPDFESNQRYEFARIITNSGNNLLAIISDIMDISKIEAGQVEVRKSVFIAQKLVQEVYSEYKFSALEKNINLLIDPNMLKEDILIESDKPKLKQVLINFVGNALKFTEKGTIEIGMKIFDNTIQFYVKDSGIGVPVEYHEHVFQRFRQLEGSSTRKYGGNGLGLAISKSLIEMLGGTINLKSKPDKGSTFYFIVPLVLK
jgi:PAS domain S-box-containing protein